MKKLRIGLILMLAFVLVGCSNTSKTKANNTSPEYYEQLTAADRKNVDFSFTATAKITKDNTQNNPPKVTVDMVVKNKTKRTVEIDLSRFRLKGIDLNSNKATTVKVAAGKTQTVKTLFDNVSASIFNKNVIVTYYADKYEVGTIKSITNMSELNNWLANVTEQKTDLDSYDVNGQKLTQAQIDAWIVNELNKTNTVKMTVLDYVFEYYQPEGKNLQIAVVENHQTTNWKNQNADPNTMPTIVRLELTKTGELDNMDTGKVFSDTYMAN